MKLLALDTSTDQASVALLYEGHIIQTVHNARAQHAQSILPAIDNLLSRAGLSLKQLDGIVFGRGPGSFTGLRIACSVAKGLGFAHDLPLFPVSTLQTIAFELRAKHPKYRCHPVLSLIDASMNQMYWAIVDTDGNILDEERVSGVSEISDWLRTFSLKNEEKLPRVAAGVGLVTYSDELTKLNADLEGQIETLVEAYPSAKAMLSIAQSRSLTATTAHDALPVYIRNQVTQGAKKEENEDING